MISFFIFYIVMGLLGVFVVIYEFWSKKDEIRISDLRGIFFGFLFWPVLLFVLISELYEKIKDIPIWKRKK